MIMRRYTLLSLFVFVLLFGVYSNIHIVHAADIDILSDDDLIEQNIETLDITDDELLEGDISVSLVHRLNNGDYKWFVPQQAFTNGITTTTSYSHNTKYFNSNITYRDTVHIHYNNKEKKVIKKGDTINLSLSNIVDYWYIDNVGYYYNTGMPNSVRLNYIDASNVTKQITPEYTIVKNGRSYNIEINNFKAPCDVYQLSILLEYNLGTYENMVVYFGQDHEVFRYGGFENTYLSVDYQDETDGLLATIIQWLTSIRDNIVNLPSKIASSLKGFFDGVVNAVNALGDKILDGIKGLFVPDANRLAEEKNKWDTLLEDRFGALYQVIALIDDYANTFVASEQKTITLPKVSVPLGEADFEFGGWEVQIVPEGFDMIFSALKMIISIVCTILFVNGLRNRFERVVDG